jgi:D-amino-acid oxidase
MLDLKPIIRINMSSKKGKRIPTILLIGVGRFGEKHLNTLLALQKRGVISVKGAVVTTAKSQKMVAKKYGINVWTQITDELLEQVDAVDIATPPETHLKIALQCLPFANVLIEKPLATTTKDAEKINAYAKKYKRILMVGHIFRFDSVVKKLEQLLKPLQNEKILIKGEFINPTSNDVGRDISLELPHLFDIINFVIKKSTPDIISTKQVERVNNVSIKYNNGNNAELKLGWGGKEKVRKMEFILSQKIIRCDFLKQTIKISDLSAGKAETILCHDKIDPLTEEISCFVEILKGKKCSYPDGKIGVRLVAIAEKAKAPKTHEKVSRPKIAIIGGGIFGTNCAIELGKFCDVTLFEKNADIMKEASFVNQYRHHWGYHYPRSSETVKDIRNAIGDFEKLYDKSIVRSFPTYYSIAKKGSKTSASEYLKFCKKHKLPFTLEHPNDDYVDKSKISLSLKTLEPIYDYKKLKGLVNVYLKKSPFVKVRLNTEVVGGKIERNGKKLLITKYKKGNIKSESFDYVINATYAKYNQFSKWFNFPEKPVRIDLVEALIVKLPIPKISLAIMDGPFTNLVPTSDDSLFTLVHIKESILERYVPTKGLPISKKPKFSNIKRILEKSAEWLPILKYAEVKEIRYVWRAVNANREHDDARPSDLTHYAFGCWSILGGKIINSVTTAKEIASEIRAGQKND